MMPLRCALSDVLPGDILLDRPESIAKPSQRLVERQSNRCPRREWLDRGHWRVCAAPPKPRGERDSCPPVDRGQHNHGGGSAYRLGGQQRDLEFLLDDVARPHAKPEVDGRSQTQQSDVERPSCLAVTQYWLPFLHSPMLGNPECWAEYRRWAMSSQTSTGAAGPESERAPVPVPGRLVPLVSTQTGAVIGITEQMAPRGGRHVTAVDCH